MKFTDGAWLHQPGVHAHYPAEAYDVTTEGDEMVVHAPTRPVRHRVDTLQGPVLTVRLSSPLENVIRVRLEHYAGVADSGPRIPWLNVKRPEVQIEQEADHATLRSGALAVRVAIGEHWELSFVADGRVLTRSGPRGMGYMEREGQGNYIREQLSLGTGECVYGLGERFTAFVKNGQVVDNWNKDGGTCSDQAYKSVPFYLTNRGYGVLVNETGRVSFELASEHVSRVQFSQSGERLEYCVIYGPTPKDVLRRLTEFTGRPALPPAWSFGLWLTTSFTTSYDEKTVTSFIDGMKERDLPVHVFHFDCFWMREFEWCNFQWDPRTFPDPAGMHNLYSVLYNETVFRVLEEERGSGEAVLFARSSYASGQRFPVHWGGDSESHSNRWRRVCGADSHSASADSAIGATISAGSRDFRRRVCTSAGWRSACFRRTAGCTAAPPTACPGTMTTRRATCCGSSRSSSAASCRTSTPRQWRRTGKGCP